MASSPLGLQALDMLRIEAGLIFFNYEFSDQTDPFEAGIGFTVALKSKDDDFVGRDALIRRQASPQKQARRARDRLRTSRSGTATACMSAARRSAS